MKIKALKPASGVIDGQVVSVRKGAVVEFPDDFCELWIAEGIAEKYALVEPSGTKTIAANGTYDVSEYAEALVNVGAEWPGRVVLVNNTGRALRIGYYTPDGLVGNQLLVDEGSITINAPLLTYQNRYYCPGGFFRVESNAVIYFELSNPTYFRSVFFDGELLYQNGEQAGRMFGISGCPTGAMFNTVTITIKMQER